jgi:SAM-dependent methyltransferase
MSAGSSPPAPPGFDGYADDYDSALNRGLAVSGEGREYFARRRIQWLAACLHRQGFHPGVVLDFGCGIGSATPLLRDLLGAERIIGVDTSGRSLEVARRDHGAPGVRFLPAERLPLDEPVDLVYCNGVFHHIAPALRGGVIDPIARTLRPGGWFSFWENNPWNPGTRYVMSRIPFDRDAVTLTPPEARGLLEAGGFAALRTDFLFVFPRPLGLLRVAEPLLSRLPLGAQYQILCRKPGPGGSDR